MFATLMKFAVVFVLAMEITTATMPQNDLIPVEKAILDGTNAQRARYGLPPLTLDPGLDAHRPGACRLDDKQP